MQYSEQMKKTTKKSWGATDGAEGLPNLMVHSSGHLLANGLHGRGEVKNWRRRRVFDGSARHARRGMRGGDGNHWGRHNRVVCLQTLQFRMLRVDLICFRQSTGGWNELH